MSNTNTLAAAARLEASKKAARNAARRNEASYLKGLRPGVREAYANYRAKATAGMPASIRSALGGTAAGNWGAARPAAGRARFKAAYEGHLGTYQTRAAERATARNNVDMYVSMLMNKPVSSWSKNDIGLYKKYRSRYQNAVNSVARGGKTTFTYSNNGKRIVARNSRLRGMARLRELGRGARASLRNKLGFAGVLGRGALALPRLAGNYGAAGVARGYGALAGGIGRAGAAGYRAGHAAGNYPRAEMLLRGARLPRSGNTKNASVNNRRAALNKALTNLREKQAIALANPTRTNVNNANSAARRAMKAMAAAGAAAGQRAKGLFSLGGRRPGARGNSPGNIEMQPLLGNYN